MIFGCIRWLRLMMTVQWMSPLEFHHPHTRPQLVSSQCLCGVHSRLGYLWFNGMGRAMGLSSICLLFCMEVNEYCDSSGNESFGERLSNACSVQSHKTQKVVLREKNHLYIQAPRGDPGSYCRKIAWMQVQSWRTWLLRYWGYLSHLICGLLIF
jgi:hypothetical protein